MVRVYRFADIPHPELAQFVHELTSYQEGRTKYVPIIPDFSIEGGITETELTVSKADQGKLIQVSDDRHSQSESETAFRKEIDSLGSWQQKTWKAKATEFHLSPTRYLVEESMTFRLPNPYHNLSLLTNKASDQNPASKYGWRVVRIESVIRPEFHSRFTAKQEAIRNELCSLPLPDLQASALSSYHHTNAGIDTQKSILASHIAQTRISYHGTCAAIISEITAHGFLIPGSRHPATGEKIKIGAGQTYGPGIYTSPNPHLALTYSSWETPSRHGLTFGVACKQIIICATVLGRAANASLGEGLREAAHLKDGAHSHVANGGEEWILGEADQVLPIFVVGFRWRPDTGGEVRAYAEYAHMMAIGEPQEEDGQGKWAVL